jgi:hypothetical protein
MYAVAFVKCEFDAISLRRMTVRDACHAPDNDLQPVGPDLFDPASGSEARIRGSSGPHWRIIMITCEVQTLHGLKQRAFSNYWGAIRNVPPAKLLALLIAIVVPGGMVLPLCYAAYAAVRRARAHD